MHCWLCQPVEKKYQVDSNLTWRTEENWIFISLNTKCDLKFLVELLSPAECVQSKIVSEGGVATCSLNQTSQDKPEHHQSLPWNNEKTERQFANLSKKSILYRDYNASIHVTSSWHSELHGHLNQTDLGSSPDPCTNSLVTLDRSWSQSLSFGHFFCRESDYNNTLLRYFALN